MGSGSSHPDVIQVLQQWTRNSEDRSWIIDRLGEGVQANIYAVRSRDRQPIWRSHLDLVVKVYKSFGQKRGDVAHEEFECLSRLWSNVNNIEIHGWEIYSPEPLYQCERPLALVMTSVPGRSLNSCLKTADTATVATLGSMADVVVAALERLLVGRSPTLWRPDIRQYHV